jgi:hypothetical protein
LLAGPVIALDFQDLQLEKAPKQFVEDDREHPVPIIRPYVYTKALGGMSSPWAEILNALWTSRRGGVTPEFKPYGNIKQTNISSAISLDEIGPAQGKPVDKVVGSTMQELSAIADDSWNSATWWSEVRGLPVPTEMGNWVSGGLPSNAKSEIDNALYGPLEARLAAVDLEDPPPLDPLDLEDCDTQDLDRVLGNSGEFILWLDELLENWPNPFFEVAGKTIGQPIKDYWVDVWLAQGWNTYGNGRWIQTM